MANVHFRHVPYALRTALGLAVVVAVLAFAVTPVRAHSALLSSSPEPGTVVTELTEVELVFNEDVRAEAVAVVVTGADGARYDDGEARVSGTTVTQRVSADVPAGSTTVAYRVVSADGHPVTGEYVVVLDRPGVDEAPAAPASPAPADDDPSVAAPLVALATIPLVLGAIFLVVRRWP